MISGSRIITASGRVFDLLEPTLEQIDIFDIATALSKENRFGGHTRKPYSVAQHSCLAHDYAPQIGEYGGVTYYNCKFEALMHDVEEAYYKDIPTPLKRLLPDYNLIVDNFDKLIREKFDLPGSETPIVKRIDLRLLATEKRELMQQALLPWGVLEGVEPYAQHIEPWGYEKSFREFLNRFAEFR